MRIPLVDLTRQFRDLREELLPALVDVMARADFILGDAVRAFEREFADYLGVRHALGVASGTDALAIALRALGIGPGDDVVVPSMTFVATALAVTQVGARPIVADVDPGTLTLTAEEVERHATPRTRAVVPVHLFGHPADLDPILEVARARGLVVLEDACQAHGARYRGKRCGAFGRAAAFSFYPGKNLGAYGDGGAVTADDDEVAAAVRSLRDYGRPGGKFRHEAKGTNSRLDTLQAAVLRTKLARLDAWNARRAALAGRYVERLAGVPGLGLPIVRPDCEPAWHLFVVRIAGGRRDEVLHALAARGIGASVHYPLPVHLQPCYAELGLGPGSRPVAERAAAEVLSLPLYPEMPESSVDEVAAAVREALGA